MNDKRMVQIFRSQKMIEAYLYVDKLRGFGVVPDPLQRAFGKPVSVMEILLRPGVTLARVDAEKVMAAILEQGYYLQMPPPRENLLKEWKAERGQDDARPESDSDAG